MKLTSSSSARAETHRKREGVAAVEFAMLALPFFALLLAILEVAIVLTASSILETATMSSARLVRTGQVADSMQKDQFKAQVCSRMLVFAAACNQNLSLDVRPVLTFTDPLVPNPVKNGPNGTTFDETVTTFDIGSARDLMLVRTWYRHSTITPFLTQAMSRADGKTMLQATSAFKNEPYA